MALSIKKMSLLLTILLLASSYCKFPSYAQDSNEELVELIFPTIPSRYIPGIETLKEKPKNVIFKNSQFVFLLPQSSKTYKSIIASPDNILTIKIKDSQNQEFDLDSEVLTFTESVALEALPNLSQASVIKIVDVKEIPSGINEGAASLLLTSNGVTETASVFISKTLSEKLGIDDSLKTTINSVSIINRPIKGTNFRFLKVFIGGKNLYSKKLSFNEKTLTQEKGFTKAILLPKNSFSGFSSRILKGNEVLAVKTTFNNSKSSNEALLFIITPFGSFTEKVSIPVCTKACGEN